MNFHLDPMVLPSLELEILILLQPWVFTSNLPGHNLTLNLRHMGLNLTIPILRGEVFMTKVIRSRVDTGLNLACTNLTNTRPTRQICTNPTSPTCTSPTCSNPTSPICTNLTCISPTCTNLTCTSRTCTNLTSPTFINLTSPICTNPTSPTCTNPTSSF